MKKFFTFFAAVLFAGSMMADGLLFEQTYPGKPSDFVSAYTKTFTLASGTDTLTYANINNGRESDNWDAVRAGRKDGNASIATITSKAIAAKVSRVIIDFTQVDASKTNKLSLQIADNAEFTNATEVVKPIELGEVSLEVATPAENMYYKVVLDMAAGSANGFNRWNKVRFATPDGGEPIIETVYDTVDVAKALEIVSALEDNASSKDRYYVEGYAVKVSAYSTQYNNQIFYMADSVTEENPELQAYGAYPAKEGKVYPVLAGDKVRAFGYLKKYVKDGKTTLEIVNPAVEFIEEVEGDRSIVDPDAKELPEGVINCAAAVDSAKTIADPQTEKETIKGMAVKVRGYVTYIYPLSDGKQSVWVADKKDAKSGVLQGAYLATEVAAAKGDYVELDGTLAKYLKPANETTGKPAEIIIEVIDGTMTIVEAAAQGIEEIVLTEKAQKVMVDGVIYIVRDNKMYNIQGIRVR